MTSMVLTLILVLLMLVALAGALRRLGRVELDERPPGCLDPLDGSTSAGTYRPLSRLFSAEDSAFLGRFGDRGKKLAARLGPARGRVLRLYLRQIRADFDGVWLLARQVAPQSPDPDFGFLIAKQCMIFHAVLALVYVRSWLGWRTPVPLHVVGLVNSLDAFRSGVRAVLQQVEPATRQGVLSKG
ncbi:MAG TPA: hypothetical protein VML01_10710 [Bryobacterales bacterium]|nr:hypothetical protein [Bryobacterales bacterium]